VVGVFAVFLIFEMPIRRSYRKRKARAGFHTFPRYQLTSLPERKTICLSVKGPCDTANYFDSITGVGQKNGTLVGSLGDFWCTGAYDTFSGAPGTTVDGFAAQAALYNYYAVVSSRITVHVARPSGPNATRMAGELLILQAPSALLPAFTAHVTNTEVFSRQGWCKNRLLMAPEQMEGTVSSTWNSLRDSGVEDCFEEENFCGAVNAALGNTECWRIVWGNRNNGTPTWAAQQDNFSMYISLEFNCVFRDPKQQSFGDLW